MVLASATYQLMRHIYVVIVGILSRPDEMSVVMNPCYTVLRYSLEAAGITHRMPGVAGGRKGRCIHTVGTDVNPKYFL